MKTIELNDLSTEVSTQEAVNIKGGYKLKDVIVTSYNVRSSAEISASR